ncbi:peptide-methionine (R)-S-oxide reductase MsrB [Anatilimnocola floriformis]|uniref:peptide-methionine (R)-S-oxide reductase MsrB n=1 Tax=Anatilimnocola floriformis TaxID=2948575 RepID=UPI0020C2F91B|nr:peptide-methionine (R)-S-oxide reductase MsrB [Anatilimnocola floriformis]
MKLFYVFNRAGQLVGPLPTADWDLPEEKWRALLSPDQFRLLRRQDTEVAFCGMLLDNKQQGVYFCAGCGLPVFSSDAKFDSGSGWPSFYQPLAAANIILRPDQRNGLQRLEVSCARCAGHLGHVFADGPHPSGQRFNLNSASLLFAPSNQVARLADPAAD